MAKVDFEKSLAKLERIVAEMEAEELSLDEMLTRFKDGMTLAKACFKRLHEAERTIELLVRAEDGSPTTVPFEPAEEE